jgi:methyl-accepting chemotaxis protein
MFILNKLSMQIKLLLLGCIMLIPIFLLGKLFFEQSNKDIAFAKKERIGVEYVKPVWGLLKLATDEDNTHDIRIDAEKNIKTLTDLNTKHNNMLGINNIILLLQQQQRSLSKLDANIALNLNNHIGDQSNLILDPDLDSYYTMDTVIGRLPLALIALQHAHNAVLQLKTNQSEATLIKLSAAHESFIQSSNAVSSAASSALKSYSSDTTRNALLVVEADFTIHQNTYANIIKSMMLPDANRPLLVQAEVEARAQLRQSINTLWQAYIDELDQLLSQRISMFKHQREQQFLRVIITLALACIVGIFVARSLTGTLGQLVSLMNKLREGDTKITVPYLNLKTEIGDIARALDIFRTAVEKSNTAQVDLSNTVSTVQSENERLNLASRQQLMDMAKTLEVQIGAIVDTLSITSKHLDGASKSLTESSQIAIEEIHIASGLVSKTEASMTEIHPGTEQLSTSIAQISMEISLTTQATSAAADRSFNANDRIRELLIVANDVGSIIGTIEEIATQTQLLALNATIEAARAGDYGRGFSVVANEVKSLANQTTRLTADISTQISEMQKVTKFASEYITNIGDMVNDISATSTTIAAAIEEQTASTSDISRNIQTIAQQSEQAAVSVSKAESAMITAGISANEVASASQSVRLQSDALRRDFDSFINQLRTSNSIAA